MLITVLSRGTKFNNKVYLCGVVSTVQIRHLFNSFVTFKLYLLKLFIVKTILIYVDSIYVIKLNYAQLSS